MPKKFTLELLLLVLLFLLAIAIPAVQLVGRFSSDEFEEIVEIPASVVWNRSGLLSFRHPVDRWESEMRGMLWSPLLEAKQLSSYLPSNGIDSRNIVSGGVHFGDDDVLLGQLKLESSSALVPRID